jgi:prolyl oligopeptidase
MTKRLRDVTVAVLAIVVAAAGPPPAPKVDYAETLFGLTINDDYHWMEAGGDDFDAWLKAQAAYTRGVLDSIPGRAPLLAKLRALNATETRVGAVVPGGGSWFFSMTRPGDAVAKLFMRNGAGGQDEVLIDPARFDAAGGHGHIDYWSVSPDGRYLIYGVSLAGAEIGTMRIFDVAARRDLPERFDRTRYPQPGWMDATSFVYARMPERRAGEASQLSGSQVFVHRLGTDPAADRAIFGPGAMPDLDIPANVYSTAYASPDSRYVVARTDKGLTSSDHTLFVVAEDDLDAGHPAWRRVAGEEDRVRGAVLHGDWLYLRTARDAPQQKIIRVRLDDPDLSRAELVVPEQEATIAGMAGAQDALYVRMLDDGLGQVLRIPWDGGPPLRLELPLEGAIMGMDASAKYPGMILRMQSWTDSQTVFAFDPVARRFRDTGLAPPSAVSFDDLEYSNVRAPASDGTSVPMVIVRKRGLQLPAPHPVLMFSYGAYNVPVQPSFNPMRRLWFDQGGILAVAHVRGSGGFGDKWHQAGRLAGKVNSITDFIACAEYLTREGWTTPQMLSAMGGSAGGIVIGGAMVRRPELFSGVLIDVGLVNMLRLEQIPIGPFNTGEFGSTNTEEGARMLHAIDVVQQVSDGVDYPGVLISTARNDTRVSPWMPAKLAARLQAATAASHPTLLLVDDAGGHNAGGRAQAEAETADFYSFLFWQDGIPAFQPRP